MATEMQLYRVQDSEGNVRTLEGPVGASKEDVVAQANKLLGGEKTYATEKQLSKTGPADAQSPDGKTYRFPDELRAFQFSREMLSTGSKDPKQLAFIAKNYQGTLAPEQLPAPRRSWGDVAGEAMTNAPQSFTNMMTGIGNAIANPVDTLGGMANVVAGGVVNATKGLVNAAPKPVQIGIDVLAKSLGVTPEGIENAVKAANEFGGVYKERYGSIEALKNTIATDPVGAAGDVSMLLGGAGGGLRMGANVAGRVAPGFAPATSFVGNVGSALSTASQYTNPLAPVTGALSLTGRAVGAGAGLGYRAFNPKANILMEAAEGRADDVINALRNPTQIVPGSRPTAAQAAADTGVVRYQGLGAQAADILPTQYLTREMEQATARRNALGGIARTEADLQSARADRTSVANFTYPRAEQRIVPSDAQFEALAQRPAMQRAMQIADELVRERNQPFQIGQNTANQTVAYPVGSLHAIKIALDDLVQTPDRFGLGKSTADAIQGTRAEFLRWLENRAPEYRTARTTFARQSEPINQMEVGQFLESKLLSPLDENAPQRAGIFAQAVRDAPGTIKRSTGQSRFERLSDVLTPDQVTTVEAIRDDLARMQQSKSMGQRGGTNPSLTKVATAAQEGLSSPNIMNRVAAISNMIIDRMRGRIDRQLAVEIAMEMLNPADAARALEAAARTQARRDVFSAPFRAGGAAVTGTMRSPFLTMGGQMNNLMPSNENALNR